MVKLIYTEKSRIIKYENKEEDIYKYLSNIDIDKVAFEYLKTLEGYNVGELVLEDFYLYDNIPMYYFERPAIFLSLKQIILYFFLIENAVKSFDSEIIIETDDNLFYDLCSSVFKLKCTKINNKTNKKKKKNKISKIGFFSRIRKGIGSYVKFRWFSKGKLPNILIISNAINLNFQKSEGEFKFVDTQIGPIFQNLKSNFNIMNLQCLFDYRYIDKSLKCEDDYIPFEFFIIYKKIFGKTFIKYDLLENKLKHLRNLDYTFKGYNLKDIVLRHAFNNISNRYMWDVIEILCAEKVINKYKIKKCIMTNEGHRLRCFITAANRNNVDTYAIQHGVINEASAPYIIKSKYDSIIPKVTFVWGEKFKNILQHGSNLYKKNQVEIVGQLRTDLILPYINKVNNNDNNKIKILYATQYFKDILEPATRLLFDTLKSLDKDFELIIKLHPADHNYEFYESLSEKMGISNIKIVKDVDLYELISWCDVVLSVHSSVVIEAALMDKPSICIVLPKYNDIGGFVRDGLSIGVRKKEELKKYLESIKSNKFTEDFCSYIYNNFYKVDGKVGERIYNKIIHK